MERPRPRGRTETRHLVAQRAAELMYFEGVKEYLRAKRKAAKQLEVTVYPNNSEIRDEIDRLASQHEGPARWDRLLSLRRAALEIMELLEPFEPRLVGSVLTGHVKTTSDIDIHAFTDDHEDVGETLVSADHEVTSEVVKTRKGGEFMDFPHYYVDLGIAEADISVYPEADLKRPQKSSITHRRMERATAKAVRRLVQEMETNGPPK